MPLYTFFTFFFPLLRKQLYRIFLNIIIINKLLKDKNSKIIDF